jgi:hypothetical protein
MIERLGFVDECRHVAELYVAGRRAEAAAAVPTAMVQQIALVGPPADIERRLDAWRSTVVTSVLVQGDLAALGTVARLLT